MPPDITERMTAHRAVKFANGEGAESQCGPGSTMDNTETVRAWLQGIIERYSFRVVNDAGCGDRLWIDTLDIADYQGYDVIPGECEVLDITTQAMRTADVIICRDVLIHLLPDEATLALLNFAQSAEYLIASTCPGADNKKTKPDGPLDLEAPPFNMVTPLDSCDDNGRKLCLWRL